MTDPNAGPPADPMMLENPRSLGQLFRDLSSDTSALVRQEIALAKLEISGALQRVVRGIALLGAGGAVATVGLLVLVGFVVLALGDLLDNYWLSALIVGGILTLLGGVTAGAGVRRFRSEPLGPRMTVSSLRETRAWAAGEVDELKTRLRGSSSLSRAHAPARPLPVGRGAEPLGRSPEPPSGGGEASLLKRTFREIMEDDVLGQAAKVAYFAIMSLPPALLVVFGLTGFFGGEGTRQWIRSNLEAALPPATHDTILEPLVQQVTQNAPGVFSVGLVLALWGASSMFVGLGDSLNVAYDVREDRGWFHRRGLAIGVMLAFIVLVFGSSIVLLAGPALARGIGLYGIASTLWTVLQWPLAFAFVVLAFWVAYYLLPNRSQAGCKLVLLRASAGAALLWLVATAAFRFYIANFGSYTATYGIVGAFLVLLLWLYLTGIVVLAGGELASEMERA